jgi:hypothetical protein
VITGVEVAKAGTRLVGNSKSTNTMSQPINYWSDLARFAAASGIVLR